MPIYEYECKHGHRTEKVLALKEFTEQITCPQCKEAGRKRAVPAVLQPSQTGKPKFVRGVGGFCNPTD